MRDVLGCGHRRAGHRRRADRPGAAVQIGRRPVGIPSGARPRAQAPASGGQLIVTLKRRLTASAVRQFGYPRGLAGRAAGWVMAHRPSNRQRNTWVVSPARCAGRRPCSRGGLRPRPRHRRSRPPPHRRVRLRHRPLRSDAPPGDQTQRHRYPPTARRAHSHVSGPTAEVRRTTRRNPRRQQPWGSAQPRRTALQPTQPAPPRRTHRARHPTPLPRANKATTTRAGQELRDLLDQAGFTHTRVHTLDLDPPVACVLATNTTNGPT